MRDGENEDKVIKDDLGAHICVPKLNKVHKNVSTLLWRNPTKYDKIILGFFIHLSRMT